MISFHNKVAMIENRRRKRNRMRKMFLMEGRALKVAVMTTLREGKLLMDRSGRSTLSTLKTDKAPPPSILAMEMTISHITTKSRRFHPVEK